MSDSQPSGRPRLTVAIIARDAEQALPATLETATRLADELIVCDTGSTDCTVEIARRYGARVLQHSWNNSFAEARNVACDAATSDWLLWLDAGEQISADDARALRNFIDTQASAQTAYLLVVLVPPAPDNISGEQVARVRLVPNRKDLRFTGRVRETLVPALEKAGLERAGLPWRILRHEQNNDGQVKWDKAVRDLKLLEQSARESGQTAETLVALGEAMVIVGDPSGAIACFRKALQVRPLAARPQREAYYGLLTALDVDPENRPQQVAVCLEALTQFPLDAQLLCAMGGYMQAEGRLDMAVRAYQTAFEFGQVDPEIWHVPDILDIAAACLSLAHQLMNNDDAAREVLEQALERNPSAVRLRRQLIELHVKHDRRKEALAEFDLLPPETPNREALRSAIRGACLASHQNWTPALAYLQTAYQAGCRDSLCLRWLVAALRATGDEPGARAVLETWQVVEPRNAELKRNLESFAEGVTSTQDGRTLRIDEAESQAAGNGPVMARPRPTTINLYGGKTG